MLQCSLLSWHLFRKVGSWEDFWIHFNHLPHNASVLRRVTALLGQRKKYFKAQVCHFLTLYMALFELPTVITLMNWNLRCFESSAGKTFFKNILSAWIKPVVHFSKQRFKQQRLLGRSSLNERKCICSGNAIWKHYQSATILYKMKDESIKCPRPEGWVCTVQQVSITAHPYLKSGEFWAHAWAEKGGQRGSPGGGTLVPTKPNWVETCSDLWLSTEEACA